MNIYYSNVDTFLNKREELNKIVFEEEPDIIQITEVLPKNKNKDIIYETEFNITGYNMIFNKNPLRGVLMYVKSTFEMNYCEELNDNPFSESLWCTIKHNSQNILLGCIYRSPSETEEEKLKSTLLLIDHLKRTDKLNYDNILITGDFNFPKINWQLLNLSKGPEKLFIDSIQDLFLTQLVTRPTRHRLGQKSSLLDLVLTNDENFIIDIEHSAPLGLSDHDLLKIKLNIPKLLPKSKDIPRYNFHKSIFTELREYISSVDWENINSMNIEDAWNYFKKNLHQGFEKYVPKKKKFDRKKPVWLNQKCMKSIKKKYELYKRYKFSTLHYDYQRYIEQRNETKRQIRKAVKEFEKKLSKECKKNVKGFWKYVNNKLKRSTNICNLLKPDGSLTTSNKEKADTLNEFFSSVYTKEDTSNMPKISDHNNDTYLTDLFLTEAAVRDKLNNLDPNKATGPDGIPSIILKELSTELCSPLCVIFNKSIQEGQIPSDWKSAEVTAIFKKGAKNLSSNYRPVSLTCISCKVLESFIRDQIQDYMEFNKFFSGCQHGFRRHRSCVTQLLEVLNDFTSFLDEKLDIDVMYLDFSKALDTVPHKRLLIKLQAYGISGKVLNWVSSFLSNRSQRVRVNDDYSEWSSVHSGIPQGSILGPVLFIIFINDLPENVHNCCKIFADDTKLYGPSSNNASLQNDILSLMKWSNDWQLKFNTSKCGVLHIGKNNVENEYFTDVFKKNKLVKTQSEKDIGVTFTNNLDFDVHINNIVKKANQVMGLIRRSFSHLDKEMFINLYKSLVRPHLEYANVIWHPIYKKQLKLLEDVQRRATKILPEIRDLTYTERLIVLNLPSIQYRQTRNDLIQTYKIIHKIDNLKTEDFFTFAKYDKTRNNILKLYKSQSSSKYRSNFLPNRILNLWNSLSTETKTSKSINLFKENIDNELKHLMTKHYDN